MNLKLIEFTPEYHPQLIEMMDEWSKAGEKIVPHAITTADYHDADAYMCSLDGSHPRPGLVEDKTFFCLDTDRKIFVGAVNIRLRLNEALLRNGGHIGDGVRPSERRKGIATKMIGLALEECRKLGIYRVLMVCNRDNIGSAKSIKNNGGVLENEIVVDGETEQRYWITLE
ncbi:MAG: GNAT family N-acetyltransferase [Christensenellales bacterium]